jgi:hypothetical protein
MADLVRLFSVSGDGGESGATGTRKKTYAPVLSINMGNLAPMPYITPPLVVTFHPRRGGFFCFSLSQATDEAKRRKKRLRANKERNRWQPPVQVSIAYEVHSV